MTWTGVPFSEALSAWEWVEPLIKRASTYTDSGFSTEDILTQIQLREMQLWIDPTRAACVTQIHNYPQHRTLLVCYLSGDELHEWFDELMGLLEDWGRQMGCKYVEEYGRKGWEKIGKKRGYEPVYLVMRKTL